MTSGDFEIYNSLLSNQDKNLNFIPVVGVSNLLTYNIRHSHDLLKPQDFKILFAVELKFQFQFQLVPKNLGHKL